MNDVVIPEGMLKAAVEAFDYDLVESRRAGDRTIKEAVEAALRWLSENPMVPTEEQDALMRESWIRQSIIQEGCSRWIAVEWQRRMFFAPEPEIPEDLKTLVEGFDKDTLRVALEAYRLGQRSKESK